MLTEKLFHVRKLIASAMAGLGALWLVAATETVDGITWTYDVDSAIKWGWGNDDTMLSITRTADNTFLVSREKLKTIQ